MDRRRPGFQRSDPHIRDHHGADAGASTWLTNSDQAADQLADRIGWQRTGPWEPDLFGRRDAPSPACGRLVAYPGPRQVVVARVVSLLRMAFRYMGAGAGAAVRRRGDGSVMTLSYPAGRAISRSLA